MKKVKFITKTSNETIRCRAISIGKIQLTLALAETNWTSKNKKRLVPIWINKKGLFVYRFAMTAKITA